MTLCVFNNGVFVNFWLNDPNEKGWIERTIAAMSWQRQNVEIYMYELARGGQEIISFDSEKNLQVLAYEEQIVNGEPQQVLVVSQTYNKIPLYLNGEMVPQA